jgi:hypothetical protein
MLAGRPSVTWPILRGAFAVVLEFGDDEIFVCASPIAIQEYVFYLLSPLRKHRSGKKSR